MHSALPHEHTTHLLSIPWEVEERLHGPALSLSHTCARREREGKRKRERERESGRERERERERERS